MTTAQFVLAVAAGLVASECTELVSWLAARLMAWAVRYRYRNPDRATIRAEELQAVLADRPTKLLKLVTATGFAAVTITVLAGRGAQSLATAGRRILSSGQKPLRKAFRAAGAPVVGGVIGGVIGIGLGVLGVIGGVGVIGFTVGGVILGVVDARVPYVLRYGPREGEGHAGKG